MQIRPEQQDYERNELWIWWDNPKDERDIDGCYERLARTLEQARAVAVAQHALAHYWAEGLELTGLAPASEGLSEVGVKACDEALHLLDLLKNMAYAARHEADEQALSVRILQERLSQMVQK